MKVIYKVEGPVSRTQVLSNHIESKLSNISSHLLALEGLDIHPGGINMCKSTSTILDNIVCPPELIDYIEMFQVINSNGVTGYIKLMERGVAVVIMQSYNHDKTWRYISVGFIGDVDEFTRLRKCIGMEAYMTIPTKPFFMLETQTLRKPECLDDNDNETPVITVVIPEIET